MNELQGKGRRRGLGLVLLVILVDVLGVALYAEGYHSHDPAMRQFGSSAIMVGVLFALWGSAARARARRAQSADGGERQVPAAKQSNRVMRTVGIALILLGLILCAMGAVNHGWDVLGYGLLGATAGALLVRTSFDRGVPPGAEGGEEVAPKAITRFDYLMRLIGVALVPLMALSAVALFLSPPASGELWPLYAFVIVGLTCTLVWAYLFGRLLTRVAMGGSGRR